MENTKITVRQAAELTGKSINEIYYAIQNKEIDRVNEDYHILLDKSKVLKWFKEKAEINNVRLPFDDIVLDSDESLKIIDGIHNLSCFNHRPGRNFTNPKYAVSNKGRVFNLTENHKLSEAFATHGYLQVSLSSRGNNHVHERVHVLVATYWCPNYKLKAEVHHIDNRKINNCADNLIWMTHLEHIYAHKLLAEAEKMEDYTEYNQYIAQIKEENKKDVECRCIMVDSGEYIEYNWVDKQTYEDYQAGVCDLEDIRPSAILAEFHLLKDIEKTRKKQKGEI